MENNVVAIEKSLVKYQKRFNIDTVRYFDTTNTIVIENNLEKWILYLQPDKDSMTLFHLNRRRNIKKYSDSHRQFKRNYINIYEIFKYISEHKVKDIKLKKHPIDRVLEKHKICIA